jgi:uncharacterized membrane protein YqaE (UPF0057 family)
MKKIFRQSFLLVMGISFFADSILAATVVPVSDPVKTANTAVPGTEEPSRASVKAALAEFKSLSRKERKTRVKEAKKELKEYKKQKKNGNAPSTDKTLLIILAILLPPLAVYLHEGTINSKFWISLLLTLLFFIPGVIYALVVVLGAD